MYLFFLGAALGFSIFAFNVVPFLLGTVVGFGMYELHPDAIQHGRTVLGDHVTGWWTQHKALIDEFCARATTESSARATTKSSAKATDDAIDAIEE